MTGLILNINMLMSTRLGPTWMSIHTQTSARYEAQTVGAADRPILNRGCDHTHCSKVVRARMCSLDAQIRTDRTMPRPNRAFLFSTAAAAVIDVLVTGRLGQRARHGGD